MPSGPLPKLYAEPNQFGMMTPYQNPLDAARNMYPQVFPRIHEVVELTGASGLMLQTSEEDFDSPISSYVEKFLQGNKVDARERVRLFRLAWDMTMSGFGARQAMYERFFFGDPVRMRPLLYKNYDKEPSRQKIQNFLERAQRRSYD